VYLGCGFKSYTDSSGTRISHIQSIPAHLSCPSQLVRLARQTTYHAELLEIELASYISYSVLWDKKMTFMGYKVLVRYMMMPKLFHINYSNVRFFLWNSRWSNYYLTFLIQVHDNDITNQVTENQVTWLAIIFTWYELRVC